MWVFSHRSGIDRTPSDQVELSCPVQESRETQGTRNPVCQGHSVKSPIGEDRSELLVELAEVLSL